MFLSPDRDLDYIAGHSPQVARLLLERMAGGSIEKLTPKAILELEARVDRFATDMRTVASEARSQISRALQAATRRAESRGSKR